MSAVYLDNAATTQVAPEVLAVMSECMRSDFGNPASAHHMGIAADKRVCVARDRLLAAIGDSGGNLGRLYWTSGGTESDALGVIGAARALARRGRRIVCSAIEHPAVRESAAQLEAEGFAVELVPVTRAGVVEVERMVDAVSDDTVVVALMLVNNEIGTIQPVADIARAIKARREHVHIHCDAVQALGKVPIDVHALGTDSLAFAAHKLHGPKGVGALWLKKRARLIPLWSGGGQQDGLRSGTLNVPGIAGMGEAVRLAYRDDPGLSERQATWRALAEILLAAVRAAGVPHTIHGEGAPRAAHVLSIGFPGVPAEPLLHVLESRGVLVSAGSACSERQQKPSAVLTALSVPRDLGTIRFSFGRDSSAAELEHAAGILIDALRDLRGQST